MTERPPWHRNRYWLWQEEQQHAEPGLRPALLRLALASLMQPRLVADAPTGTRDLPGDVVGDAVESALRFCGVLAGHTGPDVNSAAFSPDGLKVVSGGGDLYGFGDNSVRIWSVATGECEQTIMGHSGAVTQLLACFAGGTGCFL